MQAGNTIWALRPHLTGGRLVNCDVIVSTRFRRARRNVSFGRRLWERRCDIFRNQWICRTLDRDTIDSSHKFENGLVLVGEPMDSVESAAFSILVPAGWLTIRPIARAWPRSPANDAAWLRDPRQPAVHHRFGKSGRPARRIGFGRHTPASAARRWRRIFPRRVRIYADLLRRPHLPADQLEAVPIGGTAGIAVD